VISHPFLTIFLTWLRGRRRSRIGDLASYLDSTTRSQLHRPIPSSHTSPQPAADIRLVIARLFQGRNWETRPRNKRAVRKLRPGRTE
jgi:hypothetical protein